MAGGILKFSEVKKILRESPETRQGCLVDTSILFSASHPLDKFNTEAEMIFEVLADKNVPSFSNVNIRTEFVDLHRRTTVPEALIDFLKDCRNNLDKEILLKLNSLNTRYTNKISNDESFLLSDKEIKDFRKLFVKHQKESRDLWEHFCHDYLEGRIKKIWDSTIRLLNVHFISLRSTENHPMVESEVSWEKMVELVERFGIGSMDAMILNLFLCSKLKVLVTADQDLIYAVSKLSTDKYVVAPDELL